MSLEAALGGRSISPASSGRSTPIPKASRRAEEDGAYKGDKTFRKYASIIERALSSWEISPEEWADYIAFLGRLLKAIQSHPKDIAVLPHSSSVASKLSQCMNPALPSGVHQKALEVYSYIFSTFGRHFVSDHLDDFFPGLSAVLSFASLSVRPALYDILEQHIIPLSSLDLRPLLKAFVLSLLPALEEETSEDFERAFRILESLEKKFTQAGEESTSEKIGFFWQCLFLGVITSPSRRQGALNFLAHELPKFESVTEDARAPGDTAANGAAGTLSPHAAAVVSPEPGLLIRAFICGLSDTQLLIQRGFLDLLVTHLPLSSPLLQARIRKDDLDRLVAAAMHVLLRREMSLNRRLWSWFLGPEPKGEVSESKPASPTVQRGAANSTNTSQLDYFSSYGRPALERSVLAMFMRDYANSTERARPFRLCLSLMDRWEIGGSIVPEMFLPAIESAYEYSLKATATDSADLIRSASLFFDSIEASLIWSNILELTNSAFRDPTDGLKRLHLCKWIIQHFNIKDEEMVMTHVPRCVLFIIAHLETSPDLHQAQASMLLELACLLLEVVPSRALPLPPQGFPNDDSPQPKPEALHDTIYRMYRLQHSSEGGVAEIKPEDLTTALYHTTSSLILWTLRQDKDVLFGQTVSLMSTLHGKAPSLGVLRSTHVLPKAMALLSQNADGSQTLAFPVIASMVALISSWKATLATAQLVSEADILQLESILTPQIWLYLSPTLPKYHVEATRVLWHMHDLAASDRHLEAILTTLVRPSRGSVVVGNQDSAEAARRFGILWGHSISGQAANAKQGLSGSHRRASNMPGMDVKQSAARLEVLTKPMMWTLDMLSDPASSPHAVIRSWLHSLSTLEQVYRVHFELLDGFLHPRVRADSSDNSTNERSRAETTRDLEYTMNHFFAILKYGNRWVSECLSGLDLRRGRSGDTLTGLLSLVEHCAHFICDDRFASQALERIAIDIVELVLAGPDAASLRNLELDSQLIDRLLALLDQSRVDSQSSLLRLITDTLRLRTGPNVADTDTGIDRPRSRNSVSYKRPSTAGFRPSTNGSSVSLAPAPPTKLLLLLRTGFSSASARAHLDKWLEFLSSVLPIFADAIFAGLIPLVECLCRELDKAHTELIAASQTGVQSHATSPESTLMALLEATEMVLARAHRCLEEEEQGEPEHRPTTQTRGLLNNVTSGVFKSEATPSRTAHANSRLTVILTFQDAIRVSLRLWIWGSQSTDVDSFDKASAATTSYNALRVRNRTRHLLEQIFAVEPLESLEVVVSNWCFEDKASRAAASLNLLHVLQGTRPKNVIPAILDALCSRTNPSALPADRLSTQSTELTASNVAVFLSAYLQSTEDDAMDEVWPDCMAFLRDVLANPMPYRQVLPALLLTVLLLAQKLENTNFGEQRKMRKELGDSFNRLLTAAFTTMPSGYTQDPHVSDEHINRSEKSTSAVTRTSTSLISALKEVTTNIEVILETPDRATSAVNSISSNLIGPIFKAKSFPSNVTPDTLGLLLQLSKKAPLAKAWKKELLDAFNDPRLLTSPTEIMEAHWFPVLYQWCLHDKERMPELLSRLAPPSSAGIMFGVGANAARLEADRKTQLNLRRISLLMLASSEDTFAMHLRVFNEKLAELFEATVSSSPSAAVKAELFMLCRAIVLSTSSIQLAPMWPIINDNLHAALSSLLPNATNDAAFANLALLHACKLLDLLITLSPDEFQLHEWLYVTDTIDAVYQPSNWDPSALSDQIAVIMATEGAEDGSSLVPPTPIANAQSGHRGPLLDSHSMSSREDFKAMARDDFAHAVLQPFLSQLSMYAYEATYGMTAPDIDACRRNLLEDLLDLSTIVE